MKVTKMKNRKAISIFLMVVMTFMVVFNSSIVMASQTTSDSAAAVQNTPSDYRCIGYYASWSGYARNYGIDKIDYSKITHLNFAFANLQSDGTVAVGDEWIDTQITSLYPNAGFTWEDQSKSMAGHFGMLAKIKKQYPNLKTIISIGGWTWSTNFSDVAADPAKRERMANSAVDFIKKYGFDGIDLDWEYPVEGGNNITHRSGDRSNYLELVKLIREKLNAQSSIDGKKYFLTIAAPASQSYVNNIDVSGMVNYLDWINVMTYDYHGGFDPQTNHNSPLYLNPNDKTGSTFSIDASIKAYINAGAQPEDLNLGLPFYGHGWVNVNAAPSTCLFHNGTAATAAGIDSGTWEGSTWDYWDIEQNYIGQRGYVRYWDDYAKCPYLYSEQTKVFITYDDKESLGYKLDYLKSKQLGGAFFWEFSGDKSGELLGYTASTLGIDQSADIPDTPSDPGTPADPTDNPAQPDNGVSAWDRAQVYVGGDQVIYNGSTYKAKWWTQGNVPGAEQWGPWQFISGTEETSPSEPTTPADPTNPPTTPTDPTNPDTPNDSGNGIAVWDRTQVYVSGDQVIYNGSTYKAKWWTQGNVPGAEQWGPWQLISGTGETTPSEPTTPVDPATPDEPSTPPTIPTDPTNPPSASVDLPTYILTGYWQNFDNGAKCLKISDVPSTYNVINVAFADSTATQGEVTFNLNPELCAALGGYTEAQFIKDIAAAKEKGQKVLISIGGEVGNVSVANETQATNFANSVYKMITKYGFDGVDIDLEHGINAIYMASALRKLHDKVGADLMITLAPQTIDMQTTGMEYFKLALAIKDILTVSNTQYYNSGTMLGYDGKVYGQGNANFLTALATIQLENGLRPDQVGIGLPATGRSAGSGYLDPSIVCSAFKCLVTGQNAGSFVPPHKYPTFRGIMTWSINWDASNGYKFANEVADCFLELGQ